MLVTNGISGIVWYKLVQSNRDCEMVQFERLPQVKRELDYFRQNITKVETVDDLMKDRRLLQATLSAYQLEDQVDARALIRKVLTEPVGDRKSLVNRLADPRYREFATAFQDLAAGKKPFSKPAFVERVVQAYETNEFEKYQGDRNGGLREALYFDRKISGATSVTHILGDRVLARVVRVALGIPESFGALDFDQQKARLEKQVDVAKFKDPEFRQKFIQRFLVNNDVETGAYGANPLLSLFTPSPGGVNFLV